MVSSFNPHVKYPLVPEIAELYKTNRKEHDKNAKEWTAKYATPTQLPLINNAPQFIYHAQKQQIECIVDIKHPVIITNKKLYIEKLKEMKFIAFSEEAQLNINHQTYTQIRLDTSSYSLILHKQIEYGTQLQLTSCIKTKTGILQFSEKYRTQDIGLELSDNNTSVTKIGRDFIDGAKYFYVDCEPVKHGIVCWRVNVINPKKGFLMYAVGEKKFIKKSDILLYGMNV